jgi:Holliday junction resolvasome RuvABC endonuclease subunit
MIILGIDPGKKGGLAFYAPNSDSVKAYKMPLYKGMVDVLAIQDLIISHQASAAYIEKQQTRGNQSGNMTIGSNYGRLTAVLDLCGVRFMELRPQQWQKKLGLDGDKLNTILWCDANYYHVPMTSNRRDARPHDGCSDAIAIAVAGFKGAGL